MGVGVQNTKKPWGFRGFILFGALFIAGFTLYWTAGRSLIVKGVNSSLIRANQSGYVVKPKDFSLSGFPFFYKGRVSSLSLASMPGQTPWSIRGEFVHMQASSLWPLNWRIYHKGDARLDMRGPAGERWLFDIRPFLVNLDTKLSLTGRVQSHKFKAVRIRPQAVIGTDPPISGLDSLDVDIRDVGADVDVTMELENIFLNPKTGPKLQSALGPRIDRVFLKATAQGLTSLRQDDVSKWKTSGTFISDDWQFLWNGLNLQGGFELTGSPTGLSGFIRVNLEDESALLETVRAAGVISASQSRQIGFALNLLPKAETGAREITLPVQNNDVIFLGQAIYTF